MPILLFRSVSFQVRPVFCQCRRAELVTKRTIRPLAVPRAVRSLALAGVSALGGGVFPNVAGACGSGGTWRRTLKLNAIDSECTTRVALNSTPTYA